MACDARLDVVDITVQFRAAAALVGPRLAVSSIPDRAEHIAAHIRAQVAPQSLRAAGEALLIAAWIEATTGRVPAMATPGMSAIALAGIRLVDDATAAVLAGLDPGRGAT